MTQPGAGVMRGQVAITDREETTRSGRGGAAIEAKGIDAASGDLVFEAMDAGNGKLPATGEMSGSEQARSRPAPNYPPEPGSAPAATRPT